MREKIPPSVIRNQLLKLETNDYYDEFEARNLDIPDLLDLLKQEQDDAGLPSVDLTKRFKPYNDRIKADHHLIGSALLRSPRKFKIPPYQRDYSWGDEQHEQFWFELQDNLGEIPDHTLPEMYMGSVYLDSSTSGKFEIIDGQQRLMTFLIMMRVIRQYLKLLTPDSPSDDFWKFSEFIGSDDFLGRILYRPNNKPVITAKEDDIQYFNLVFEEFYEDITRAAGQIDYDEEGSPIKISTLLVDKLGVPERLLSQYLTSSKPSDKKYQATSHRLILDAYQFYRDRFGKYIGATYGLEKGHLKVDTTKISGNNITIQATSRGLAAAGVDAVLQVDGKMVDTGSTDKSGKCTLELTVNNFDEAQISVEKFGKTRTINFDEVSDLKVNSIQIDKVITEEREFTVKVLDYNKDPVSNCPVEIEEFEIETESDGTANINLEAVEKELNESLDKIRVEIESDHILAKDIEELEQQLERSTFSHQDRAQVLINILQVLFHSMRVVHVDFGMDNPEYKINVFQSLNDRGKELDIADIIRARIIGSDASNPDTWEEIYRRHGKDSDIIEEFLKDYLIAEQGLSSPSVSNVKSLFSTSRPVTGDVKSGLYSNSDDFLERLNTYSKRYFEISEHTLPADLTEINGLHHDSQKEKELRGKCNRLFARLDRGVEIWKPFVLLVHKRFAENSDGGESLIKILETVEKIVLRYSFYGTDISSTVTSSLFPDACRAYKSGKLNPADPEDVRDKALLTNVPPELRGSKIIEQLITKDNWQTSSATTIFLSIAENTLSSQSVSGQLTSSQARLKPDADVTIEHILPSEFIRSDDVKNKSAWLENFFSPLQSGDKVSSVVSNLNQTDPRLAERDEQDISEYFVNDIGNMMLLSRSVNSAVQNKLFSKKFAYYYLTCKTDMDLTEEPLLLLAPEATRMVELVETLAVESGLDDGELTKLLGLLLGTNQSLSASEISRSLHKYSISKKDIKDVDIDDAKGELKTIVSSKNFDETDTNSIPQIIEQYNKSWNITLWQMRKLTIVDEIKDYILFEDHPDEFDGVSTVEILKDDVERRRELRPAR